MKNRALTVVIADDHPVVRSGIRHTLENGLACKEIQEAGDGATALKLIRELKPDLALLDIEMPEIDGFAVVESIQNEQLPVHLIFMSMYNDEDTFNKAMDIGINGFVLKENAVIDIVDAVQSVMDGKYYLSPSLSDHLMRRTTGHRRSSGIEQILEGLTPTERKILKLIARQKTTKTIAEELFNSPKTIEKHRSNICSKLDLHGAYALLKFAFNNKERI